MNALKQARKRAGHTQASLAAALGVTRLTIARYELGSRQPSIAMLQRLKRILGLQSVDQLLDPLPAKQTA